MKSITDNGIKRISSALKKNTSANVEKVNHDEFMAAYSAWKEAWKESTGQTPEDIHSGEEDVGGWPISGHFEVDGLQIGEWGPTSRENWLRFPDGHVVMWA